MPGHAWTRLLKLYTLHPTPYTSTRYANAVALLERYVPVTGSINGVFGAVAGAACMIGPNLVALLARQFGTPATQEHEAVYRCVLDRIRRQCTCVS